MESIDVAQVASRVKKQGCHLLPGVLDDHECRFLREQIDLLSDSKNAILQQGMDGADRRFYGFENLSEDAHSLIFNNESIKEIFKRLYRKRTNVAATLLAQKISPPKGQIATLHWHRDSFLPQYKAFLFLNDVDRVGGAHELYSGTFKWKHKLKTLVRLGFAYRNANDGYRSEETLNKILSVENELVTIPCTQGSILFSDTSHLHRSGPCIYPHNRYSVTFYTWKSSIPDHVLPWISKG